MPKSYLTPIIRSNENDNPFAGRDLFQNKNSNSIIGAINREKVYYISLANRKFELDCSVVGKL